MQTVEIYFLKVQCKVKNGLSEKWGSQNEVCKSAGKWMSKGGM